MASAPYDIVLLPEPSLAAKAIRTSQELQPMGTEFVLGTEQCLPHLSLYMTQLKTEDLPEVSKRLARIAQQTKQLQLAADEYVQEEGYIDASYARVPEIEQLQQAVLDAINPIRDGMRTKDEARLKAATGPTRANLEQYGYRGVGELFRPHLSFTRFTNRLPIPLEDMGAPSAFSGTFVALALCEMGDNGTCLHKIQEFPLQ
jgi:hypothetical protein